MEEKAVQYIDNQHPEFENENYDLLNAPFDWNVLDTLLLYKSSCGMCAEWLGVHPNTIKNHIRQRFDMTFSEYAELKLTRTKVKLIQSAIEKSLRGNTILHIFCLKNLCGWQDKMDAPKEETKTMKIEIVKDN